MHHTSGDFDLVSPVTVAAGVHRVAPCYVPMPVGAASKGPMAQPGYGHSVRDEEVQGLAIFTASLLYVLGGPCISRARPSPAGPEGSKTVEADDFMPRPLAGEVTVECMSVPEERYDNPRHRPNGQLKAYNSHYCSHCEPISPPGGIAHRGAKRSAVDEPRFRDPHQEI